MLVFLKKMAQHQIIDLTCEDRNTILNEEPEIKIIYENLEVQVIYDRNKYKKQNLFKYKEYLMKEYWKIHKFNKCQKVKKSESKMLRLGYQNKGYKMLTKLGWKPDEGLGIYGQGMKYPIEVEQLTHRMGLGYKD